MFTNSGFLDFQFFYKRTSFSNLNLSTIWSPRWIPSSSNNLTSTTNWVTTGLGTHYQNNSMLNIGSTYQTIFNTYPVGGLTLQNWVNGYVDLSTGTVFDPGCHISEIMIFNKALTYQEINALSVLTPAQLKTAFINT